MKYWITLLFMAFFYMCSLGQEPLNVMTFNIRLNTPNDSLNAWPHRKDFAASQVLFYETHLLGVQEALHDQMMDLQERLPNFAYVGGARDDGKQKGEYSAIFYDKNRLQLLETKTFWLSEQPEVPGSKGWDAQITRIVTWAKFRDKKTKKTFYHFNTHFDHIGKIARRESAAMLIKKVQEIAGKSQVIVTGDFNSKPSDEPIQVIVNAEVPFKLIDTKGISAMPHYGPNSTFSAFRAMESGNDPIDYIFVKNGVKVLKHATLSEARQGRFSSDHFPVIARVVL